jgi:hypothetical protein
VRSDVFGEARNPRPGGGGVAKSVIFFLLSRKLLPLSCFILSFLLLFHSSQLPPLHAEHRHHRLVLIWICHICFHNSCLCSSSPSLRFMHFLFRFMKLLPEQQASFLSPWYCPTVPARLPACVSTENSNEGSMQSAHCSHAQG